MYVRVRSTTDTGVGKFCKIEFCTSIIKIPRSLEANGLRSNSLRKATRRTDFVTMVRVRMLGLEVKFQAKQREPFFYQSHFSFKRTPGITSKQENSSQQDGLEAVSSPLSSYSRNWPTRSIGGDDRSIPTLRSSFNAPGSSASLPRHYHVSRLDSSLSGRRSLSPTREGDGSRLPRIQEDPTPNAHSRRFLVKEEMSSPDVPAASRLLVGGAWKPNEGDGGVGFRCEPMLKLDAYIDLIRCPPL